MNYNEARDTATNPMLSLQERDLRWRRTRALLEQHGLKGLVVFGMAGRERFEAYLSNEAVDGAIVLPLEGQPVLITWVPQRITRRMTAPMQARGFWVSDIRTGLHVAGLTTVMKEKGLEHGRIGVVGLETRGPGERNGIVPYGLWKGILDALPAANFTDITIPFCLMMLHKSEEELVVMRRSCDITEKACARMLETTQIGASEFDIYAAVMETVHSNGGTTIFPNLIMGMGADEVGWGPPLWVSQGGPPRIVKAGDVVQAEVFAWYGGMESQAQMAIAVAPISREHAALGDVARKSYDAGLKAMQPGVTFASVCEAMAKPVADAGCWHLTPLLHSLAPSILMSQVAVGIENMPGLLPKHGAQTRGVSFGDVKILPGMVLEFEPNPCKGNARINIGGTILMTENGPQELNSIPNRMHMIN